MGHVVIGWCSVESRGHAEACCLTITPTYKDKDKEAGPQTRGGPVGNIWGKRPFGKSIWEFVKAGWQKLIQ